MRREQVDAAVMFALAVVALLLAITVLIQADALARLRAEIEPPTIMEDCG